MEKRKRRKKPGEGKASIVSAASLAYALRGYKIVAESWEDARLQGKKRKSPSQRGTKYSTCNFFDLRPT